MNASDLLLAVTQIAVALVLGLLPLWLFLFGWPETRVFRVASAVAFTFNGALLAVMVWSGRRLTLRGHPPRVPYFPSAIALLLGAAAAADAAGAAGLLRASLVPAYVGSLMALLVASVLVLAVFIVILARLAQREP